MRDRPVRVSYAVATTSDLAARIWSSRATQQSFAIAGELAASPNSIRWTRDITINDVDSDDFDESSGTLAIYEESLTLRRRLFEIDPRNNQWQRDAAYFLDRIGDEYRKVGMRERATTAYEESLVVWRHLANIDRRNPQLQLNISECLDKLGDLKLGVADGRGALAAYEESLTIHRHLSKDAPSNPSRQLNVAGSLEKIGDLKLADGDAQGALAAYREMLSIDRALVTIDGSNSEWQRNLSLSLERFGDVMLAVGDTVAAVAAYEQTVALRRRLAASDKSNTQWQREASASLEKIGRLKRWAENNIEMQRDLSATSERLENTSLSAGTILRKLSSIPKLIVATSRQRYIRVGLASVGKLSTQVRACVQGFQRSTVILRKLSSLIAAIGLQSRAQLGISSAFVSKLPAQVRACVRGLERSVEVNGRKLKWLFPAPSRSHGGRVLIPNQNESIAAEAQHDGSTHGQSDVLAPIGKANTASNSLTASPSSTVDKPNDATSVEALMITGGCASKMDIQPQVTKSPVKARSGKRRRRKRKPSPRLSANQKSDMVRARMN